MSPELETLVELIARVAYEAWKRGELSAEQPTPCAPAPSICYNGAVSHNREPAP
jgi:hypothetical protein